MKRFVSVLALCAAVAVPTFAVAEPAVLIMSPTGEVQSQNPNVTVTLRADEYAAQINAAVQRAKMLNAAAVPAPAEPAKASVVTAEGVLGFSWAQLGGGIGTLALLVFGFFKGANVLKAKQMVIAAAEGAWHIAERAGYIYDLDGATKGALALEAFIEAMGGSVSKTQIADAKLLWKAQSAKAGPAPVMIPPAPTVDEKANAKANAEVEQKVAEGKKAGDVLREAKS